MTAAVEPLTIFREEGELLGRPIVSFACSGDDYTTPAMLERYEPLLRRQMEAHWITEHRAELAEMGLGPCGVCGQLTNRLRIRTELDNIDAFLCVVHAPKPMVEAS